MGEELDRFAAVFDGAAPGPLVARRHPVSELIQPSRFFKSLYKGIGYDLRLQLTYPHET